MKITSSGLDYELHETPQEVTALMLFIAESGNVWPSVYLDYERGKDAVAAFLRERRKRGEHWRMVEWHAIWEGDNGDRLYRILADEMPNEPGVYK